MRIVMNNCVTYVQSPFFKWCEHVIPYLPFIFKNKRQRVKCRQYFRYYHLRQVSTALVEALQKCQAKPFKTYLKPEEYDFEWELTTDRGVL